MGWVSIFDPIELAKLLRMPDDAKPIAIICLGHVSSFYRAPMLVETGWTIEKPLSEMLMENSWQANISQNSHLPEGNSANE